MISHFHKAVFVHVPKTGGQSIELAFMRDRGLNWKGRTPFLIRPNRDPRIGPERLAHLFGREYLELGHLTQSDFDTYYKFAFVREPVERLKSSYRFNAPKLDKRLTLRGYLEFGRARPEMQDLHRHTASQCAFLLSEAGELLVDEVFRFEDFARGARRALARSGVASAPIPHKNAPNTPHDDEMMQVDGETLAWIAETYRDDFERFGYPLPA